MPSYQLSASDHKIVLRNFEGFVTTYEEPLAYQAHDPLTCAFCRDKRPEPGQQGVSGLLDGDAMFIKPEGFEDVHQRGGGTHRLRSDKAKWVPLGIGNEEPHGSADAGSSMENGTPAKQPDPERTPQRT
jgi:lysine 2,3-aminomutase